jgi:hypothetical protein
MLPTSLLLQWSTNERPSEDSAKLKTTASANRAGPGSRAERLGDSAASSLAIDSARPDGPPVAVSAADATAAAPLVTVVAASAAASLARPIVIVSCGMVGRVCLAVGEKWKRLIGAGLEAKAKTVQLKVRFILS